MDLPDDDDVIRPVPRPVYCSFSSRPSLDFADLSSPCFLPASMPASSSCPVRSVAVVSSPVAAPSSCQLAPLSLALVLFSLVVQLVLLLFRLVVQLTLLLFRLVILLALLLVPVLFRPVVVQLALLLFRQSAPILVLFSSAPPCRMSSFASGSVSPGYFAAPSVRSVWSGSVPSRPVSSFAQPLRRVAPPVCPRPVLSLSFAQPFGRLAASPF